MSDHDEGGPSAAHEPQRPPSPLQRPPSLLPRSSQSQPLRRLPTPTRMRSKQMHALHDANLRARYEEAEDDELEAERRERDTLRGTLALKLSMYLVMLFAGALGSYFAYKLGVDAEMAEFENQYFASVGQVQYSLQRGLSAKAGAGALAAAYFASAGSNFPNATYPGWNAIAYSLNLVAQVRGIAWLPLVYRDQLPGYQQFAVDHYIGVQWANATIQQCGFVNETDFAAGKVVVERNIRGGLFAGNASVHQPINASAAYYFPLIHHAPIHTNEAVIMYDLNSEAVRARTISTVLATRAAATTDFLRLVQDTNANLNRIASLALTPVIVNDQIVGISNTVYNWDSVLLQALPTFIAGIDAVLSSQLSNRTFTMRLSGGKVDGVGLGDLHENAPELASYARSVTATLGTTWTVTLYPTRELLESYRTNGPRDRCIAVLVVIIVCICLFVLHDWLARTRSVMLVRMVQATSRIVDDVFPKTVRNRMVKHALARMEPVQQAEVPLSQGAVKALGAIQKFIGLEAAQTRAVQRRSSVLVDAQPGGAIADTFPSVTVLFSDVVGFTQWSSGVPPDVVFRVLGAMFAEFDALAHRLGIFKVETIGDCYMAVCGLPETTPAHAERMADFALGMFEAVQRAAQLTGTHLALRIGMHSGTVTAGVLMGERSRFQLFGETVNAASRMESTGQAGRVQVSAATASLLKAAGYHELEYRGKVAAKGLGEVDTYWLLRRTAGEPWISPRLTGRSSSLPTPLRLSLFDARRFSSRSSAASQRSRGSTVLAEVLVAEDAGEAPESLQERQAPSSPLARPASPALPCGSSPPALPASRASC